MIHTLLMASAMSMPSGPPAEIPTSFPTLVALTYTGADYEFTVPAGVWYIKVEEWGAGGGSNRDAGFGSGGNFATGVVAVTPGEKLIVRVGGGGLGNGNGVSGGSGNPLLGGTGGFPGGGKGGDSTSYGGGGGGGGYTGLFRGATPLLIAGAGGGGVAMTLEQPMQKEAALRTKVL